MKRDFETYMNEIEIFWKHEAKWNNIFKISSWNIM